MNRADLEARIRCIIDQHAGDTDPSRMVRALADTVEARTPAGLFEHDSSSVRSALAAYRKATGREE